MKLFNWKKILIFFLFYLCSVTCNKLHKKLKRAFRCKPDETKPIPIPETNILPYPKNIKNKRNLDADGFKDFNIYLDLENFNNETQFYEIDPNVKQIYIQGMQKAVNTLKSLLKVKPLPNNYCLSDEDIKRFQIYVWNQSNIGTAMSNQGKGILETGIDLFIFVRFDSLGESTLATAGARFMDTSSGHPIIGVANINKDIDYTKTNSLEYFSATILHEFIHILGFSNHFFTNYYHNNITKIENGIKRVYLNSPKLLQIAKKYFNCEEIDGIELEDYGGDGTVGSHWEERILLGDIMNGVVYPE